MRPTLAALAAAALLAACSTVAPPPEPPEGPPARETVLAATADGQLVRFNAGQPRRWLSRTPIVGLEAGDRLVGIDFRVARGVLYALSARGRLYTLDVATGRLAPVGAGTALDLGSQAVGFDFNPAADRIRVVTADGRNWRLHPDTGAVAAVDGALAYAAGDAAHGQRASLAGAAYTYHPKDSKLTTNYAIDTARGWLVRQGSLEGATPVVSPNTGQLFGVGPLGGGPVDDVAFDIADVGNAAWAALRRGGHTMMVRIDLASGRATPVGSVGDGKVALWGLAIEP